MRGGDNNWNININSSCCFVGVKSFGDITISTIMGVFSFLTYYEGDVPIFIVTMGA